MRYEFVGRKVPYVGKTLWEILGNLKNFGVGRWIKENSGAKSPKLNFFKVVKVQPVPPLKREFANRNVIVWIDEIRGERKLGIIETFRFNKRTKFELIPKNEEKYYLEKLENLTPPVKYVSRYCSWPPLYKILWEKENSGDKKFGEIPRLESLIPNYPGGKVIVKDEELKKSTCSLYKGELTVEEMYKEMVRLKLLLKANT